MIATRTLEELVAYVNDWCEDRKLTPASGQSADVLSARTLRYYRTLGLISPPEGGAQPGYGELHCLQLLAIRVLQAQGLPLRRIQSLLYGRSKAALKVVIKRGAPTPPPTFAAPLLPVAEDWRVVPCDDTAWLILRKGRTLAPEQVEQIKTILHSRSARASLSELQSERTA